MAIVKEQSVCQMILQFPFLFCYACAKSSILSITAISLSKYICSIKINTPKSGLSRFLGIIFGKI